MTADWSRLSPAQLRCIDALDFAPPMHQTHLAKRHKVRGSTMTSLEHMGLIRCEYLRERDDKFAMPFWRLTQLGLAYQRDWRLWRGQAAGEIARITGATAADVTATLNRGIAP